MLQGHHRTLRARRSSLLVSCLLFVLLLQLPLPATVVSRMVVSRIAAIPPGLSAKFNLNYGGLMESMNMSLVGFPDCAPYPYKNCPWPAPPPPEGAGGAVSAPAVCTRCAPRGQRLPSSVRVACVGDSITAGVGATSAQHTYPSVLQGLLGDRFVVTNLGSSGATMQNEGYRPFVQTAMYRGLLESTWDVVVLMLGTNDGRDPEQGCDAESYMNMPCAALAAARAWFPETSPAAYVSDAISIINEVRAHHERAGAKVPTILLMTPPPVVFDGVSGVQRSIVNRIQPALLNSVAASQNLGPVIDLHPSFGGPDLQCPLSRRDEERGGGEMAATACGLSALIANEAKEAVDLRASRFCRLAARCTLKPPPRQFRSAPPRSDQAAHWCDYLHPSDEGYRAIAAAVQRAIMKAGFGGGLNEPSEPEV